MKHLPLVLALSLIATPAFAISDPSEMLPDHAQELRAEKIGSQLRCLVCQNVSIEDSDADVAKDLRHLLRQRVAAGDSDQQVIDWMVARYGNFVRLKPPFEPATWLLWLSPLLALLAGAGWILLGRRRAAAPPPLSDDEQAKLARLMEQE
jgi:cytochrome c-type biogenesis protein CcmH